MIVLAIAGVLIAAVLIAVPQLQRNQRNSARRAILGRIKTEIDNYSSNNNSEVPVASNTGTSIEERFGSPVTANSFYDRYFDCSGTGANTTCVIDVRDPQTNLPLGLSDTGANLTTYTATGLTATSPIGSVNYVTNRVCDGELLTTTGASNRNYSIQVKLEGAAIYCLDNR